MKKQKWVALFIIPFLTGCSGNSFTTATLELIPTDLPTPIPATETLPPTVTPIPLVTEICSPLQGIALEDLRLITSNPYFFKYPFSEGAPDEKNHPAIDLGFYTTKNIPSYTGVELSTDDGFPIQTILPGKIVETVNDRYPFGNMILIETRVNLLSPELLSRLNLPEPYSREELEFRFPCDKDQPAIQWSQDTRSIYVLYAHMKTHSSLQAGNEVQCGQVLGGIGATGNSSENIEHLHLEVRIGPSDADFGTIANYDNIATNEERYNYCIWALSQEFQSFDPAFFWETAPLSQN